MRYLRYDLSQACGTSQHTAFASLAVIVLLVFALGLPVGTFAGIMHARRTRSKGQVLAFLSVEYVQFLCFVFSVQCCWCSDGFDCLTWACVCFQISRSLVVLGNGGDAEEGVSGAHFDAAGRQWSLPPGVPAFWSCPSFCPCSWWHGHMSSPSSTG